MMVWSTVGLSFLGLDNVLVALALAPLCQNAGRFWLLTAWFAGVEAAAPLAGSLLHEVLPVGEPVAILQSALLITFGLTMLGSTLIGSPGVPARMAGSNKAIVALAFFLGIDNLVAGAAFSPSAAIACGLVSSAPVLLGCLLGRLGSSYVPPLGRVAASGLLLLAAGIVRFA